MGTPQSGTQSVSELGCNGQSYDPGSLSGHWPSRLELAPTHLHIADLLKTYPFGALLF